MRTAACRPSFFFNGTATTEIYTLSLHDALPIYFLMLLLHLAQHRGRVFAVDELHRQEIDRKSTRLNSSHQIISYAVFCLKKKKTTQPETLSSDHAAGFSDTYRRDRRDSGPVTRP